MKAVTTFALEVMLLVATPVLAGGFDNQFRILGHVQKTVSQHFGLAGWGIVADTTNPQPRGLLLSGFFYHDENRWAEFMGGTFLDGKREEPLFNFRLSEKGLKPLEGWLEVAYSPGPDKLLLSHSVVVPVPISLFDSRLKVGGEADLVIQQGTVTHGVGPRVVFPLPVKGWTLAIAYQFKDKGPDITRTYLVLGFSF